MPKKATKGTKVTSETGEEPFVPSKPKRARKPKRTPTPIESIVEVPPAPILPHEKDKPDRRLLLWVIVGIALVAIVGTWVALFRWNVQGSIRGSGSSGAQVVRDELQKTVDDFQKNFTSITTMLEERFSRAKSNNSGTTTLSPEALKELEARIRATTKTPTETQIAQSNGQIATPPIDWNLKTWQRYTSTKPALTLQYPNGWTVEKQVSGNTRLVAFARDELPVLFVDVYSNPERKTLKRFYEETNRVNLYQAARGGTKTVYVDGVRAVAFNDVAQLLPSTIVSIRIGASVYEFSILGTDDESKKILETMLKTVQFK